MNIAEICVFGEGFSHVVFLVGQIFVLRIPFDVIRNTRPQPIIISKRSKTLKNCLKYKLKVKGKFFGKFSIDIMKWVDDFKLSLEILDFNWCHASQDNSNKIKAWCIANNRQFNIQKCKIPSFLRCHNTPISYDYDYMNQSMKIERVFTMVDLEMIFNPSLAFKICIKQMLSIANKSLGFVLRVSWHFTDHNTFKIHFNTWMISKLGYREPVILSPQFQNKLRAMERC